MSERAATSPCPERTSLPRNRIATRSPIGHFLCNPSSFSACGEAPSRTAHIVERCPLDLTQSHAVLQAEQMQYPYCYLGLHTDKCCHNVKKTLQVSHPKGKNEFGQRAFPPLTLLGLFQTLTNTTSLKYFMHRNFSCCAPSPHGKASSRTPKLGPKASDHPFCMLEKALTQPLHALWGSNAQNSTPPSVLCLGAQSRPL